MVFQISHKMTPAPAHRPHKAFNMASLVAEIVKNLPARQETWVQFLGREDPLEKGMATYASILAWGIPWTKELDRPQFMISLRVGHN